MKKLLGIIVVVLVISVYYLISSVANVMVGPKRITVTQGDTAASLYEKLDMPIANWRFKAYMRLNQASFKLQSGTYSIPESVTFASALQTALAKPSTKDLTITILPGWNIADVDAYLTGL